MNSIKTSLILLLLALFVVTTQQAFGTVCTPSPGLTFAQCKDKIDNSGCPMKFNGPGCSKFAFISLV